MTANTGTSPTGTFEECRGRFEMLVGFLSSAEAGQFDHAQLEERIDRDGREVLRLALQGHLDQRAEEEQRIEEVIDANGVARGSAEPEHRRVLSTIFGEVSVRRVAYRQAGHANLHPADGVLNLPPQRHSHGLRQLAAVEASRGSFDEAAEAIGRATGVGVGKRQLEKLALAAAVDFEDFNAQLERSRAPATDVLVLTADGKGIVMRPEGLTEGTAKAAARSEVKLRTRLSKGEKTNRKRMATVGCVYDATPVPRAPTDVMASSDNQSPKAAPVAQNKWLVASVAHDAATVVNQIFDEATRRDPTHRRAWVALVDGNNHQIARIRAEADTRDVKVSIVCDFIHVLEYLWAAAWSFYREGDRHAEAWVKQKALAVLAGQSSTPPTC